MIVSAVSPVYKAKGCLRALHERLTATLSSLEGVTDYEIVLVEDCGRDGSWELIEEIAARDPRVRAVQLSRNFGQHPAITAGLDLCRGDWVVVLDCDLQDRPEDIPLLFAKAKEGYDIVCARRTVRKDSFWKRKASGLYWGILIALSGLDYDQSVANFRILSRKVLEGYGTMRESTRSFGPQIHWLGFKTAYVDVVHGLREEGKSSYTLRRLVNMAFETIISYSNKPLKISVAIGFGVFVFSIAMSVVFLVRKLIWSVPITGWTSLMVSLWFLGGIIISNLGVLGLYIGKIYDETRHRPIYLVSRRVNF